MVNGTYGRYVVRFNGKILFHSVPYIEESPDTLEWEEYLPFTGTIDEFDYVAYADRYPDLK